VSEPIPAELSARGRRIVLVLRAIAVSGASFFCGLFLLSFAYGASLSEAKVEDGLFFVGREEEWIPAPPWLYVYVDAFTPYGVAAMLAAALAGWALDKLGDPLPQYFGGFTAGMVVSTLGMKLVGSVQDGVPLGVHAAIAALVIPASLVITDLRRMRKLRKGRPSSEQEE
jgi:hypothetical protein